MNHRITLNFWSNEIFKQDWNEVSKKSQFLAESLCKNILQPVRDLNPDTRINISDGCRDSIDVLRLLKEGYYPSVTTDHFYGEPQVIPPCNPTNLAKIAKYGEIYTYSTGAVDMAPDIPQTEKAFMDYFKWLVDLDRKGIINAGQIILEKGKYTYWIHISNSASLIYQDDFIKEMGLQKTKYLTSLNNDGKYKVFNV